MSRDQGPKVPFESITENIYKHMYIFLQCIPLKLLLSQGQRECVTGWKDKMSLRRQKLLLDYTLPFSCTRPELRAVGVFLLHCLRVQNLPDA